MRRSSPRSTRWAHLPHLPPVPPAPPHLARLTPRSSLFPPLDQLLAVLNPIQRKWVYLEPIFGRGAMPHEQARFRRVDDEFRALMSSIVDDPRVFSVLKVPQLVT